jgi:hypothetical protein
MMTSRVVCFALSWALPAAACGQSTGSLLATSDIWSEHPIQRPVEVEGRAWLAVVVADGVSVVEPIEARWRGSVLFGDSVFALEWTPDFPPESMRLLVAGVPGVRVGSATTALEGEASLSVEERRLEIALGDARYTLQLGGSDAELCDATVTLVQGSVTQTLYPPGGDTYSCDAPHFSVQWAGDLDGDGRLDLVTTFSPKYSWYPRQLHLSSGAGPGELVGLVATTALAAA